MSLEEEYYINLHVGGKFVRDPYVRYLSGKMNDSSTIDMINYWVKHKEIDLYVEHEINTIVFVDDESTLVVACLQFDSDGNEGGEGGEVVGNEGGEGGEFVGNKCGEGEGDGGEVVASNGGEGEGEGEGGEVACNTGGGKEGIDIATTEGDESDGGGDEGVRDESDSDSKQNTREVEGKTSEKGNETVLDETESETSGEKFEAEVVEEVDGEELNDSVDKEEDGNETLIILIVMIMGAYLGQKIIIIVMFL
ncbi:hypothetical protein J1N35_004735 [Gossypium stocksii]|uniref:Uncharacterized protein n=1 Tax=Gossypium stocksii TaxID=47602 RepID=A0A9D3WER6_9ROSI|nr:hypothetical protein J1N35_004735 [Gossypium stocksii]